MLTKRKSRIVTTILAVAILATMFAGFASASEVRARASNPPYDFYLELPAYGVTDLATARVKTNDNMSALYELLNVDNPTGYRCFLNIRDENGSKIVGKDPLEVYDGDTGYRTVKYISSEGVVGVAYRPSGQTYSNSAKSAFIEGKWVP